MKKLVQKPVKREIVKEVVIEMENSVVEEEGGLLPLLGKRVVLLCNYIYTGVLTGVNSTCVELEDASMVFATGEWSAKNWKNAEKLPAKKVLIQTVSIECFFESNK
jgi:hypothetical protein